MKNNSNSYSNIGKKVLPLATSPLMAFAPIPVCSRFLNLEIYPAVKIGF